MSYILEMVLWFHHLGTDSAATLLSTGKAFMNWTSFFVAVKFVYLSVLGKTKEQKVDSVCKSDTQMTPAEIHNGRCRRCERCK